MPYSAWKQPWDWLGCLLLLAALNSSWDPEFWSLLLPWHQSTIQAPQHGKRPLMDCGLAASSLLPQFLIPGTLNLIMCDSNGSYHQPWCLEMYALAPAWIVLYLSDQSGRLPLGFPRLNQKTPPIHHLSYPSSLILYFTSLSCSPFWTSPTCFCNPSPNTKTTGFPAGNRLFMSVLTVASVMPGTDVVGGP